MATDTQRTGRRTELMVGIFLFVGLVLLSWLILTFGKLDEGFEDCYQVEVRFSDATGVIEGTSVRLAGALIGQVSGPPMLEADLKPMIRVPIDILNERSLPNNAIFQVQSASILGDRVITVTIPEEPSSALLANGDVLTGGAPGGLDALQEDAVAMMSTARESLDKFDTALDEINELAASLNETVDTVNGQILSDQNVASFSQTLLNIEDASIGARNASADLKPVLADARKAMQEVTQLAERAQDSFDELDTQLATVGPAMDEVPETLRSINRAASKAVGAVEEAERTFAKVGDTVDSFNQSDGLVGTLTKDEEVSTDTKTFIKNLRRHGILGYRDEATPENDPRERFSGRRR